MNFMESNLSRRNYSNRRKQGVVRSIKASMRLDPKVIFSVFRRLPNNFTKSVIAEENKKLRCLPSSIAALRMM